MPGWWWKAANTWWRIARSLHGLFVNGQRVTRHSLRDGDRIEFGAQDCYVLIFAHDGAELKRLAEQMAATERAPAIPGVGGGLAKLRVILDLARTMQSSFSIDDVLASVVDAALAITQTERGFLLLRTDGVWRPAWLAAATAGGSTRAICACRARCCAGRWNAGASCST